MITGAAMLASGAPTMASVPEPGVPDGDADDGIGLALVIVGVAAVVGVVIVLVIAARRPRRERMTTGTRAVAPGAPRSAVADEPTRRLLADLDDLHDRGTLEALAGPAGPARDRWRIERQRATLAADAAGALARTDARWLGVQDAVVAVVDAVDVATESRDASGTDPMVISEAVTTVHRRRSELLGSLAPLRT